MHGLLGLEPDWLCNIRLFSVKKLKNMLLWNGLLDILLDVGGKEVRWSLIVLPFYFFLGGGLCFCFH